MNITVVGMGYVGLSIATLLAQHNTVRALEIVSEKVDLVNRGLSPIKDTEIEDFLANKNLDLQATTDPEVAYENQPEYVVVAAPTNYDEEENYFDTSAVEVVIEDVLKYSPQSTIVIKSTIPVGYTEEISKKYNTENIIFSPEFLREGKALYDNLHPSRVIVGEKSERGQKFADLLVEGAKDEDIDVLLMHSTEAEATKLFSNTYLAMRVSYFNELDTYAEVKGLDTQSIIDGVGLDPRIGDHYNNPSFGYGGYCLPKDTKQLLANYDNVPNNLIRAIVESNATRKHFIASQVLSREPDVVGIYRLTMKKDSDNFRQSAIFDIMKELRSEGVKVVIYEPTLTEDEIDKYDIIHDLDDFKDMSSVIIANRYAEELADAKDKIYTRDLYHNN